MGETLGEETKEKKEEACPCKKGGDSMMIMAVVLVIGLAVGYFLAQGTAVQNPQASGVSPVSGAFVPDMTRINEIKQMLADSIYLQGGENITVTYVNATSNGGFITITFSANGQPIPVSVSNDYKYILGTPSEASVVKAQIEEAKAQVAAQGTGSTTQPAQTAPKSDKPVVELFVMSYCPYGTQIEKGIIPVLKSLQGKVDFQLKFVDYLMHGTQEGNENTRQYCLQKEQNAQFISYMECFLSAGDSAACLKASKVDEAKLTACVAAADKEFSISVNMGDTSTSYPAYLVDETDNLKYGVQGSPTLVINGQEVSTGRSPAALLSTICSAFNTPPDQCRETLSTETPSAGFGYEASGAATDATCG
ncbi:MAG: hypothetical protein ACP5NX_03875 [Candidatus Bilamarchaeaceae archaeon]